MFLGHLLIGLRHPLIDLGHLLIDLGQLRLQRFHFANKICVLHGHMSACCIMCDSCLLNCETLSTSPMAPSTKGINLKNRNTKPSSQAAQNTPEKLHKVHCRLVI